MKDYKECEECRETNCEDCEIAEDYQFELWVQDRYNLDGSRRDY